MDRGDSSDGRWGGAVGDVTAPPTLLSWPPVPVASADNAVETRRGAFPHIAAAGRPAMVVHVIEKARGARNKVSVERRQKAAEAGTDAETEIRHGTDVAGATVPRPRGGSWLLDLLTGDVRDTPIAESDRPTAVLSDGAGHRENPGAGR